MAIKLIVEYSSLHLTTTKQKLASLSLSSDASALLQFVNLNTSLYYRDLETVLFLDADPKNLYFSAQYNSPHALSVNLSEDLLFNLERPISDSLTITESLSKATTSEFSDSLSIIESSQILVDKTS